MTPIYIGESAICNIIGLFVNVDIIDPGIHTAHKLVQHFGFDNVVFCTVSDVLSE